MNPIKLIKTVMAINLEKRGHSLLDFEHALQNLNTGEGVLAVTKLAEESSNPISGAASMVGASYLPVTTGVGSLLGLGLDAAEEPVRAQNKRLKELRKSIETLKKYKQNLAREHGIN